MRRLLIESHYLPSIAYFSLLSRFDEVVIETREHFNRQTFRNRCRILGPNGVQSLVVPIARSHGKVTTDGVRIDNGQRWREIHWRSIEAAYRRAPFFEPYADELRVQLFAPEALLLRLNNTLLTLALQWLGFRQHLSFTKVYQNAPAAGLDDFRGVIHPKRNTAVETFYQPGRYTQVFGAAFIGNLSILDLIFCTGPEAARIVQCSAGKIPFE